MCSACSEVEFDLSELGMDDDRVCICGHLESEHYLVRVPASRGEIKNACFHDDAPEIAESSTICPCLEFRDCLAPKALSVWVS